MDAKEKIIKSLSEATGLESKDIQIEVPENSDFGDYSSNVALQTSKEKKKNPREKAEEIVKRLGEDEDLSEFVDKIEIAGPGFINFYLSKKYLSDQIQEILKEKGKYGSNDLLKGKRIVLEHTSPNPQTTIMLGHLRNNFLGMSVSNLLEFEGAEVIKDAIVNDRGIHICRSMWGYLAFAQKEDGLSKDALLNFKEIKDDKIKDLINGIDWTMSIKKWVSNPKDWFDPDELGLKPDHANLIWYVLGSKAFKLSEDVNRQVKELLQSWENEERVTWKLWSQILAWSAKGYEETYSRVGSKHDYTWHESELYKGGRELVEEGIKKGVFVKSEGAVVTNLKSLGLPDTVAIKSDGTSTYLVFDINLTLQKQNKYKADFYIWDIGMEQSLYFKQLFAICEKFGLGKKEDFYHLAYALVNFKGGGKMATRTGSVVMADEVLDELEAKVKDLIKKSNQKFRNKLTELELKEMTKSIAVGAIKYSILKYGRETTMFYDINESISLEGNSGPYLQYTYARTQSVLSKAGKNLKDKIYDFGKEELEIIRILSQFGGVIEDAAKNYSPNTIASYLYGLAQKYNSFYNSNKIIDSEKESERLAVTAATGQVIKNGLKLLGIEAPERM